MESSRSAVGAELTSGVSSCRPGINAQARKLQKSRSRVASLFVDGSSEQVEALGIWRSLSEMDLMSMGKEASRAQQGALREDPQAEADKEALQLGTEKEETESSDDNTTQYSIHPPFDFPYFLLLQGYNHRQVRRKWEGLNPDSGRGFLRAGRRFSSSLDGGAEVRKGVWA